MNDYINKLKILLEKAELSLPDESTLESICVPVNIVKGMLQINIEEKMELTKNEAYAIAEFIDMNIFDAIRNDTDWDNFKNLINLVHVYEKCCELSGYDCVSDY